MSRKSCNLFHTKNEEKSQKISTLALNRVKVSPLLSDKCDGRRSVVSVLARAVCQLTVPVETRQVGGATRLFLRRELFHRRGPTTLLLSLNQTQPRAGWSNLTDKLILKSAQHKTKGGLANIANPHLGISAFINRFLLSFITRTHLKPQ